MFIWLRHRSNDKATIITFGSQDPVQELNKPAH